MSKGGSKGTPAYMAPELYKRPPQYSAKSDIFALGIVLWELVTREIPFKDAEMRDQIIEWIKEGNMDPIPDGTHPGLQRAIEGAWARDPAQRPSLAAIAALLAEAASAAPAASTAPAPAGATAVSPQTLAGNLASGLAGMTVNVDAGSTSAQVTMAGLASGVQVTAQQVRGGWRDEI